MPSFFECEVNNYICKKNNKKTQKQENYNVHIPSFPSHLTKSVRVSHWNKERTAETQNYILK